MTKQSKRMTAPLDASRSMATVTAVDDHVEGDTYLTGKTTASDVIRLYVDGKEMRAVKVVADGTFKLYVLDLGLKAGTELEIVALDADRREGASTTATSETFIPAYAPYGSNGDRMGFGSILEAVADEDVDRVRFYIDGTYYNTVGLGNKPRYNVNFYLPWEQRLDLSGMAVFELVSVDKRGREGGRLTITPDIRVTSAYNRGDYVFATSLGRGTHRVVIKDASGRVMDEGGLPTEGYNRYTIEIKLDHTQYKSGETYYVYGVDSKGNEGPAGQYVYEVTNASHYTFTPATEKGWPVGGDAQ